jgi:hypothetical protein
MKESKCKANGTPLNKRKTWQFKNTANIRELKKE